MIANILATCAVLLPVFYLLYSMRKWPFGDFAAMMYGLMASPFVALILWAIWR